MVEKLKKYKYLNDLDFSKWWVISRTKSNPKGPYVIRGELAQKGIPKQIVESVLKLYPKQSLEAQKLIEKKFKNWQKLAPLDLKKKIYSYLMFRGFDSSTVTKLIAQFPKKR